jgi:hypothetical protein
MEMIEMHARPHTPACDRQHLLAVAHEHYQSYDCFTISYFTNFGINFISFNLCSTTEQMPALDFFIG